MLLTNLFAVFIVQFRLFHPAFAFYAIPVAFTRNKSKLIHDHWYMDTTCVDTMYLFYTW